MLVLAFLVDFAVVAVVAVTSLGEEPTFGKPCMLNLRSRKCSACFDLGVLARVQEDVDFFAAAAAAAAAWCPFLFPGTGTVRCCCG